MAANAENTSPQALIASMGTLYQRLADLYTQRARNLETGGNVVARNRNIDIQQREIANAKARIRELEEEIREFEEDFAVNQNFMTGNLAFLKNSFKRNSEAQMANLKKKLGKSRKGRKGRKGTRRY